MCGRYTLITTAKKLAEAFNLAGQLPVDPRYNIAPGQNILAVISDRKQTTLNTFHWGLIPPWADDQSIGYRMINARAETLDKKRSFSRPFKHNRCLIPATGFYEWQKTPHGKQPMYITLKNDQPFAFAGLYEHWQKENQPAIDSCTIITTTPNDLLKPIHDRMPVILPPDHYDKWLDPSFDDIKTLQDMLRPLHARQMQASAVSTRVNSPSNDDEKCIEPVNERSNLFTRD